MFKNRIVFAMILLGIGQSSWATFQVISDNDDTIKITDTLNTTAASWNTIFSRAAFTGSTELFRSWARSGAEINIVSGGLSMFSVFTTRDLNYNLIPFLGLYERPGVETTIYDFKIKTIISLASKNRDNYVLIGDDTQSDFDVYAAFRRANPTRVLAAYIHKVTGRTLPPNVQPYYTDFEVAVFENVAGRISDADLGRSITAVMNLKNIKFMFPNFAVCPKSIDEFSPQYFEAIAKLTPSLKATATRVTSVIVDDCLKHISGED